jgi:hypothetical protein
VVQLGPQYDLAKRITQLEQLVANLASNQIGQAFSATQSDGSIGMQVLQNTFGAGATAMVFYQGPTTARDPSSGQHPQLLYVGQLSVGGSPANSGAIFYRPDGSRSMTVGDRGVGILDPQGHVVFNTDEPTAGSGQGLADPWIPLGTPITNSPTNAGWPSTTATSLGAVSFLTFPAQHPQITWYGSTYCPAGTTGQVQVQVNNGAAGATHSVGAGFTSIGPETIPLGSWSWQDVLQLSGNATVTAGAGPIYFHIFGVWGRGS